VLSPSRNHRAWLEAHPPSLRYDGGDVVAWQRRLRRRVRECLGLQPAERVALNVRQLWKQERRLGTIEKILFTAEPAVDVPAYLCLPRNVEPPYPVMICVQGHSTGMHLSIGVRADDETRPMRVSGDRDFGLGCLRRGVAALCIEQRSFGERGERHLDQVSPHMCHDAAMHALMLGRTLLGERVWDIDRGIDYLAARGDMDLKRLGVMGNSGGGTASVFAAAVLPRVRFAMPSSYFCTFRDSIMSIYHCADNYLPGLLRYAEMADVLGLFAPRPVVLVNGQKDSIFPIAGTRRAFRDLRRIYRACGAADRCHLVVGRGGHRFYARQAWPVLLREMNRVAC
jgi:hypothetical protein